MLIFQRRGSIVDAKIIERESVDIQIYVTENHKTGTVMFKPAPDEEPREQQRHRSDGTESTFPSIKSKQSWPAIGQVGMTSLQVNCSLTEVNTSVFIAVF